MAKTVPGTSSSRRVVELLLQFSEERPRATVAELAAAVDITVASAYRYVALLRDLDLLEEGPRSRYQVTSRVMPLARAAQLVNDRARLALPAMKELAEDVGETVILFELRAGVAVCIQRVEASRPMRFTFELGRSLPVGRGAASRMLLANLTVEDQREILRGREDRDLDELLAEIAEVAQRGWATSHGEADAGVWACSVPVVTSKTHPLVMSIAGPDNRIPTGETEAYVEKAQRCADRIRDVLLSFVWSDGSHSQHGG